MYENREMRLELLRLRRPAPAAPCTAKHNFTPPTGCTKMTYPCGCVWISATHVEPASPNETDEAKDAARYRWLRSPRNAIAMLCLWDCDDPGYCRDNFKANQSLDAAIEAARKAST